MKRAVFTFWQLPEEEGDFLDYLESTGPVVACPNHWVSTEAEASPADLRPYLAKYDPDTVKLGLSSHLEEVVIQKITEKDKPVMFSTDLMTSSLVGYTRGRITGAGQLERTILAAYLDLPEEGGTLKPAWFRRWVKKIFAWVKRRASGTCTLRGFAYPATPQVLKLLDDRKIQLAL
jgi:hypothetical protein